MRISDWSSDVCSSDLPRSGRDGHIHPHSVVSGTFYVAVPPGSGALKLEAPRLPMLMAAPARTDDAPEHLHPFVYAQPAPGRLFLWASWLRHEVLVHAGKGARISISFNYPCATTISHPSFRAQRSTSNTSGSEERQ